MGKDREEAQNEKPKKDKKDWDAYDYATMNGDTPFPPGTTREEYNKWFAKKKS